MSYIRYTYEQLKTFCTDAFQKFGFTADEAASITDVLLSDVYGIDVNINTVAEMRDLCEYLEMDSVAYLGDVDFSAAKQSSYK